MYGDVVTLHLKDAHFNTTDFNKIKAATTLSISNRITPYEIGDTYVKLRISGDQDIKALDHFTITVDESVLTVPHTLKVTVPVEQDIEPPVKPPTPVHPDANKHAHLTVSSIHAEDLLHNSGKSFTIKLKDTTFTPGCIDPLRISISSSSNVPGIATVWSANLTSSEATFTMDGGFYTTDETVWNFELSPEATASGKTLYISVPIVH